MLRKQLLDTTRGRIVTLLRAGALTTDEIASKLDLTPSAVRVQITAMERDGVVMLTGKKAGATRPSHVYELTAEVEQLLSKAYVPLLTHLIRAFADDLSTDQVDSLLRRAGKSLADELSGGKRFEGNLGARVGAASQMLNEQLGALTRVEKNGGYVIRGLGCPLAALTGKHPGVCVAIESLVAEVVRARVHECCDRSERPRCCFEIGSNGH
jgi:DeoR family transcriptional regulator, suf operon transcriptional repressor